MAIPFAHFLDISTPHLILAPPATLDRRRILINILQVTSSLENLINRRLLRQNLSIRILPDRGKLAPSCEIFRVSLVALRSTAGNVSWVWLTTGKGFLWDAHEPFRGNPNGLG